VNFKVGDQVKFCGRCTNPHYRPAQPGAVGIVSQLSTCNYNGTLVTFLRVECRGYYYLSSLKNWRLYQPPSKVIPQFSPTAVWEEISRNLDRWNLKHGRKAETPGESA